jgi:hypothetical protein
VSITSDNFDYAAATTAYVFRWSGDNVRDSNSYPCTPATYGPDRRIFGAWVSGWRYLQIVAELERIARQWPRVILPRVSLVLRRLCLEIRQPCWSSLRWRSLT